MTDRYAVFGNPVAHSKSPVIHRLFAEQTKQDITYDKQLVELGQFSQTAKKFFDEGGKGLNITVPFKLDAYEFSDVLSERAKLAGAVNTLKKMPDGKIYGDNTDGVGLMRDITQNLGWEITGKNILILGAGGAVRGIMGPLLDKKPNSITIANRTLQKAEELSKLFSTSSIYIKVWDISPDILIPPDQPFDLIINGSSGALGKISEDISHFVFAVKHSSNVNTYDMMYGKNETHFLSTARKMRCSGMADGLGMLVEQAAESFRLWRGDQFQLNTQSVIDEVRRQL